jgi:hypothetical protein
MYTSNLPLSLRPTTLLLQDAAVIVLLYVVTVISFGVMDKFLSGYKRKDEENEAGSNKESVATSGRETGA